MGPAAGPRIVHSTIRIVPRRAIDLATRSRTLSSWPCQRPPHGRQSCWQQSAARSRVCAWERWAPRPIRRHRICVSTSNPGRSARYFVPIGRPEAALLTQTAPSRDGFGQLAWPEAVPGHFRCRWDQSHAGPDLHRTGHHESRWPLPAYRLTLRRRQATPTDRKTITGAIPLPAQHRDGRPAASTVDRQSVVASAALVEPNGGASAPPAEYPPFEHSRRSPDKTASKPASSPPCAPL